MRVPWPPCEQIRDAYPIDSDICEVAGELWARGGEQLSLSMIGDSARGRDLLLYVAISVTRRRERNPGKEIKNLRAYLHKSYTRRLQVEQKKSSRFVPILDDTPKTAPGDKPQAGQVIPVPPKQETEALLNEAKRLMATIDKRLPVVFELRALGFNYEQIAPSVEMDAGHLRSWYSKKMRKLEELMRKDNLRKARGAGGAKDAN